ncbi:hypothetical protein [Streptomyces sp. NPDC001070]
MLVLIIMAIGLVTPADIHLAAAVICDIHDGLLRSPILPTQYSFMTSVAGVTLRKRNVTGAGFTLPSPAGGRRGAERPGRRYRTDWTV